MIQKWVKQVDASGNYVLDASGNYKFEKQVVGSDFADNIIVVNPRISKTPVKLNSVLGAFKKNFDNLYGNVKWLAMHGGGGSGNGGGGGGGSDKPSLRMLDKNGFEIANGSTSLGSSDSYTFTVELDNPRESVSYSISVTGGNTTKYITLSENQTTASVTVTGLSSGTNEISCTCQSVSNGSYTPQKVHFYMQIAGFSIAITDTEGNAISGTVTKNVGDDFTLNFIFTPSVKGTVKYQIDYSELTTSDYQNDKGGIRKGTVDSADPITETIDFVDMGALPTGTTKSITVTGSLQVGTSTITGSPITIKVGYVAGDGFLVTTTSREWNDLSSPSYSKFYFENGNNPDFNLYVQGKTSDYSALYAVYKSYYLDSSNNWQPFTSVGSLDGWTYNAATGKAQINNLTQWQSNNVSAYLGSNTLRYVEKDILFTYTDIPENAFSEIDSSSADASTADTSINAARLRIDLYIINTQGAVQKGPTMKADGTYVPDLSMKSLVKYAEGAVPAYVKGITHTNSAGGCEEYSRLYFNFDTIKNRVQDLSSTSFSFSRNTGATPIVLNYPDVNNKITGIVDDASHIQSLRFSGGSYGEITLDSLSQGGFISESSDPNYDYDWVHGFTSPESGSSVNIDNGICIELVFRSEPHTDNIGTIFSMAQYDSNNALSLGINVTLENVAMTFQAAGSTSISFAISQGEFTQLDFTLHREGNQIIGKIFKNGVPQGLSSVDYTDATVRNLIDVFKGIYIGGKMTSSGIVDSTDVNVYGLRLYKSYLSDYEIMKNWLISKTSYEKVYNADTDSVDYDYTNIVNPLLRMNFFNSTTWRTDLWDYDNIKPASGDKLLEAFTTISGNEQRELPVLVLTLSDSNNYGYPYVRGLYDETQADQNNNDPTKRMSVTMQYYAETGSPITTSAQFNIQGTSTQQYFSKNFELYFGTASSFGSLAKGGSGNIPVSTTEDDVSNGNQILFTPKAQSWLPENEFTLKADVMDSAHANNAAIGKWINGIWTANATGGGTRADHFMPLTPPQAVGKDEYKYCDKVKATLEGFPCLVFVKWGSDINAPIAKGAPELMEFQGIYSFNLGRGSSFNLGFKRFTKYELSINASSTATDDAGDIDKWNDATTVTTDVPSMVNRYRIEPVDPKVFSFESTTNEPTEATGFQQFDLDVLKQIWSIKYLPGLSSDETTRAYNYLQSFVKRIAYLNKDDVQQYWYRYDDTPNAASAITQDFVYVPIDASSSLNNVFFKKDVSINTLTEGGLGADSSITYTHKITTADVNLMGSNLLPNSYVGQTVTVDSSFMTWEQGLFLYQNDTTEKTWSAYNANFATIRPDLNKSISLNGDEYQQFVNSFCLDAGPTDNLIEGDAASGRFINYLNFSRYFLISMLFGMIDSLGKNFTLRTWNLDPNTGLGLMFAAFYDMDTALALSNFGNEDVNAMAFVDYWINVLSSSNESMIKVITENYPTKVAVKKGNTIVGYNYVAPDGTVIAYFDANKNMPPDPDSVMYDMPNSHLWHVIRFLAYLTFGKYKDNEGTVIYSPALEWSRLRALYFPSVDDFIENYFKKQNENVGEFVYNFDYRQKYQHLYTVSSNGTTTQAYSDMHFCHGTRVEYVTQWLKNRVNFLDGVFNLKGLNTIDSNENYDNQMNSGLASALPANVLSADIDSVYTTTNASGVRLSAEHKTSTQTVYSSTPTILRVKIGDISATKRYLLIPYVETDVRINIDVQKDATWVVTGYSDIFQWDNLKDFNFITFDCGNWSLKKIDFNGLSTLTTIDNYKGLSDATVFDIGSTPTNVNDFTGMTKLEDIDLSNTNITSFTSPEGNLETLNLSNTDITTLNLSDLVNLKSVDISDCAHLKSVILSGCGKLQSISFSGNQSLTSVSIADCKSLSSFSFDAQDITSYTDATSGKVYNNADKITNVSITGQNDSLTSVNISNITNAACKIDLSGATSLNSLTLSNLSVTSPVILPATIDTGSDATPTDFNIFDASYRQDNPFSISLSKVGFQTFAFGNTNQSYVTYSEKDNSTGFAAYSATIPSESILNLAVFKNVSSASFASCSGIEYIALPWTDTPYTINSNVTLNKCTNVKRVFGNLSYGHATFRNMSDSNFRIENWKNTTDASVKAAFESILAEGSSLTVSTLTDLIGDEDTKGVQDIVLKTRVTPQDTTDFAYAFHSTGISGNDFYYIFAELNLANKAKTADNGIHSLSHMFDSCPSMTVDSPSHLIFKYLAKSINDSVLSSDDGDGVTGVNYMFTNSGVSGIIYSPDSTKQTTGDNIGTLTPFALNPDMVFSQLGWNADKLDNSTYFYNDGTTTGFQQTDMYNVFNSKTPIISAQWDAVNTGTTGAYLHTMYFLKNFPKVSTISNSFKGLTIYPDNVMGAKSSKEYTRLFDSAPNVTSIIDSFNFTFSGTNQYMIDIFGGDSSLDASFPTKIDTIENSFNLSPYSTTVVSDSSKVPVTQDMPGYFFLTDNMFANFRDSLKIIIPVDEAAIYDPLTHKPTGSTPDVTITGSDSFLGSDDYIVKAYCSYDKNRRFPLSIANCKNLQYAQGFYRNFDFSLSIFVNANNTQPISELVFPNTNPDFDFSDTAGWALDSSVTVSSDALAGDSALINASSMFRNMRGASPSVTPREVKINKDMPVYFPSKVFNDCTALTNLAYGFAENHYMVGTIPSDLLTIANSKNVLKNLSYLFYGTDTLGFIYQNMKNIYQSEDLSATISKHILLPWHSPSDTSTLFPNAVSSNVYYDSENDSLSGLGIYLEADDAEGYNRFTNQDAAFIRNLKRDNGYVCDPSLFDSASTSATVDYMFANTQWQTPRIGKTAFSQLQKDSSSYFVVDDNLTNYMQLYIEGNPFSGFRGRVHKDMFSHFTGTTSFEGVFYKSSLIGPYSYATAIDKPGNLLDPSTFWNNAKLNTVNYFWSCDTVQRNVTVDASLFYNNPNLTSTDFMFGGTVWFGYVSKNDVSLQVETGIFDRNSLFNTAKGMFTNSIYSDGEIASTNITQTQGSAYTFGVRGIPDRLFTVPSKGKDSFNLTGLFAFNRCLTNVLDISTMFGYVPDGSIVAYSNQVTDASGNTKVDPNIMTLTEFKALAKDKFYTVLDQAYYYTDNSGLGFSDSSIGDNESSLYYVPAQSAVILKLNDGQDASAKSGDVSSYNSEIFRFGNYRS